MMSSLEEEKEMRWRSTRNHFEYLSSDWRKILINVGVKQLLISFLNRHFGLFSLVLVKNRQDLEELLSLCLLQSCDFKQVDYDNFDYSQSLPWHEQERDNRFRVENNVNYGFFMRRFEFENLEGNLFMTKLWHMENGSRKISYLFRCEYDNVLDLDLEFLNHRWMTLDVPPAIRELQPDNNNENSENTAGEKINEILSATRPAPLL